MECVTLGTDRPTTYGQSCHLTSGAHQCCLDVKIHFSERQLSIFEKCMRHVRRSKLDAEDDEPHREIWVGDTACPEVSKDFVSMAQYVNGPAITYTHIGR